MTHPLAGRLARCRGGLVKVVDYAAEIESISYFVQCVRETLDPLMADNLVYVERSGTGQLVYDTEIEPLYAKKHEINP